MPHTANATITTQTIPTPPERTFCSYFPLDWTRHSIQNPLKCDCHVPYLPNSSGYSIAFRIEWKPLIWLWTSVISHLPTSPALFSATHQGSLYLSHAGLLSHFQSFFSGSSLFWGNAPIHLIHLISSTRLQDSFKCYFIGDTFPDSLVRSFPVSAFWILVFFLHRNTCISNTVYCAYNACVGQ